MNEITVMKDILIEGIGQDFPGASFGVVFPDGHIETDYVGFKSISPDKKICNGSEIYDVASLTKVIVTTSIVMKLNETNKLSLSDTIVTWLPRFKHKDIRITDLLTHTSGLPADIPRANKLSSKEDVLSRIFEMDKIYPTGTKIIYSDIGFILIGLIIEEITQLTICDAAKQLIFNPLHMTDTSYRPDKNRAAPTEYREDDIAQKMLIGQVHDEKAYAMQGLAGHAGLFSTSYDVCLFIKSILFDEVILKRETIDEIFISRKKYKSEDGNILIRAYGWDKNGAGGILGNIARRKEIIGHTGFTGCHIVIDRKYQMGFVVLSNAIHPKRELNHIIQYRKKIADAIIRN